MFVFINAMPESLSDRVFILELYRQYYRLMFSTARSCSHEKDICEEVVQESLLKLIKKVPTLKEMPRATLASYIASTTRNTAINYVKRQSKQSARSASLDDEVLSDLEAPIPSLDEMMESSERRERIIAMMERMSIEDRTLLEGKYILDYSDETLAKLLDCKPSSIRMKLTRARRRAIKLFEKEGDGIK